MGRGERDHEAIHASREGGVRCIEEVVRILFVSSYPASPATYGGQRRLEGLMSGLAQRHEVSAVALSSPRFDLEACASAMRGYCRDVVLVPSRSEDRGKRLLQLRSLFSRRSFESRFLAVPALERALDRALTETAFDVVVLSPAIGMGHYRFRQAPTGSPLPRVVRDEHNIEFDLQRQLSQSGNVARRLH